ncbi:hypothetical protein GCM10020258_21690 [Sphingomonas yabuuchiae]
MGMVDALSVAGASIGIAVGKASARIASGMPGAAARTTCSVVGAAVCWAGAVSRATVDADAFACVANGALGTASPVIIATGLSRQGVDGMVEPAFGATIAGDADDGVVAVTVGGVTVSGVAVRSEIGSSGAPSSAMGSVMAGGTGIVPLSGSTLIGVSATGLLVGAGPASGRVGMAARSVVIGAGEALDAATGDAMGSGGARATVGIANGITGKAMASLGTSLPSFSVVLPSLVVSPSDLGEPSALSEPAASPMPGISAKSIAKADAIGSPVTPPAAERADAVPGA